MNKTKNPLFWVPSIYFIEGLPYTMVMTVAVIMYKNLGIPNEDIALYTSWLYLPWVIKPFWSPVVDALKTKKWWMFITQTLIGGAFACVAFTLPVDQFFQYSLAAFWLVAFTSATNDIATDGFYMIALKEEEQSLFVGIRSIFYRLAMWAGQGGIVMISGELFEYYGNYKTAWSIIFFGLGIIMVGFALYHRFILPDAEQQRSDDAKKEGVTEGVLMMVILISIAIFGWGINEYVQPKNTTLTYILLGIIGLGILIFKFKKGAQESSSNEESALRNFFNKKDLVQLIGFILLFRLGEGQLVKIASPFLLDDVAQGGIGLDNDTLGFLYGTIGLGCLIGGGILGGIAIYAKGLKFWLIPMVLSINLPNIGYWLLSSYQPESQIAIGSVIAIEQFFYGFGFTALMMYMVYVSKGEHKTSHYAICTGFMALGMMLSGMVSGFIQKYFGYTDFFLIVVLSGIPGLLWALRLKIDPEFGIKKEE
ncbi:AmpG family muropeptide MFS transporter [Flammeovirga sp. MY04]|uniref:MFS transporter n=1 Tax=Flammeovirga sp. MY04 TaxID=1191459 RepID=UPI0008062427|nr:MFS transporter [Flammeovirga sp. MY04]ANQ50939.1 AmpG family muropeptide MFS transporter [Flammeovirga sp. MY04]